MITFSSRDVAVLTGFILKGSTASNIIVKRVHDTEKVWNHCSRVFCLSAKRKNRIGKAKRDAGKVFLNFL